VARSIKWSREQRELLKDDKALFAYGVDDPKLGYGAQTGLIERTLGWCIFQFVAKCYRGTEPQKAFDEAFAEYKPGEEAAS